MIHLTEESADAAWKKALAYILEHGENFTDYENRVCREARNVVVTIKNFSSITKPIETINSFQKWIYPPFEELEAVILSKKEITGYYYNYGARAFHFNQHTNQVDEYVIPLLKKDPTSRRATIVFYNPDRDSLLHRRDTPGMITANILVRNKKLHITVIVRSNDFFFGWPANVYQVHVLQRYVAKELGYDLGPITIFSISAHIFEDQFEAIKKVLTLR